MYCHLLYVSVSGNSQVLLLQKRVSELRPTQVPGTARRFFICLVRFTDFPCNVQVCCLTGSIQQGGCGLLMPPVDVEQRLVVRRIVREREAPSCPACTHGERLSRCQSHRHPVSAIARRRAAVPHTMRYACPHCPHCPSCPQCPRSPRSPLPSPPRLPMSRVRANKQRSDMLDGAKRS